MDLPTIYLDFDGVLHSNQAQGKQLFSQMPLLEQALKGYDVNIVISSSWRFQYDLADLRMRFPPCLSSFITDSTGEAHVGRHARWHEILQHSMAHAIENFVILDDAAFEFPKPCPPLILCNGSIGLDLPQVSMLKNWLIRI